MITYLRRTKILIYTRARLRRVPPPLAGLDQYILSNVESSFLSQNDGLMTLTVKINDSHFQ